MMYHNTIMSVHSNIPRKHTFWILSAFAFLHLAIKPQSYDFWDALILISQTNTILRQSMKNRMLLLCERVLLLKVKGVFWSVHNYRHSLSYMFKLILWCFSFVVNTQIQNCTKEFSYTGLVYVMLGEEGTFFLTVIISINMSGFGLSKSVLSFINIFKSCRIHAQFSQLKYMASHSQYEAR